MGALWFLLLGCAMLAACAASTVAPLYGQEGDEVIPYEYLVVLKHGATYLSSNTRDVVSVIKEFAINDWHALHVSADEVSLQALREDPNVEFVEANSESVYAVCNSQYAGSSIWGLPRTSQRSNPDYDTDPYLYDSDGSGVDVYIVDSGVYIEHNDIKARAKYGTDSTGEGDGDLNGHGTHVAGTVGGDTYGVAKNANLIAVKVITQTGSGTGDDLLTGIQWLTTHHQGKTSKKSVVNMSLGVSPPSPAIESAINASIAEGIIYVAAAGNENSDACGVTPARVPGVITTAASNIGNNMYMGSNHGKCVDVIAPGEGVLSAYIGNADAAARLTGTSMASPHAAGVVARYLSTFDDNNVPSPANVKDWLTKTATPDAINIDSYKSGTPNRLVYAACG